MYEAIEPAGWIVILTALAILALITSASATNATILLSCEDGINSHCQNITEFEQSLHPAQPVSPFMQWWHSWTSAWTFG